MVKMDLIPPMKNPLCYLIFSENKKVSFEHFSFLKKLFPEYVIGLGAVLSFQWPMIP